MKVIERSIYLTRILRQLNRGMILVLVGQRRVGKSFILKSVAEWIIANRPGTNLLFINKEFNSFGDIADAESLYSNALSQLPEGEENYLLIDEVQDIENYDKALRPQIIKIVKLRAAYF